MEGVQDPIHTLIPPRERRPDASQIYLSTDEGTSVGHERIESNASEHVAKERALFFFHDLRLLTSWWNVQLLVYHVIASVFFFHRRKEIRTSEESLSSSCWIVSSLLCILFVCVCFFLRKINATCFSFAWKDIFWHGHQRDVFSIRRWKDPTTWW